MKAKMICGLTAVLLLGVCAAYADSHERTVAIWKCERAKGKTEADVQAANALWVKHVNEGLEEGEIRSFVLNPMVGDMTTFLYVDSFPSGAAWLASREAMESEEGQAIEKQLEEVATCKRNALYESERTMPPE